MSGQFKPCSELAAFGSGDMDERSTPMMVTLSVVRKLKPPSFKDACSPEPTEVVFLLHWVYLSNDRSSRGHQDPTWGHTLTALINISKSLDSNVSGFWWFRCSNCFRRMWWFMPVSAKAWENSKYQSQRASNLNLWPLCVSTHECAHTPHAHTWIHTYHTDIEEHAIGTLCKPSLNKQVLEVPSPSVQNQPWRESSLALISILSLPTSCLFSSSSFVLTWWLTKSSSLLSLPLCQQNK